MKKTRSEKIKEAINIYLRGAPKEKPVLMDKIITVVKDEATREMAAVIITTRDRLAAGDVEGASLGLNKYAVENAADSLHEWAELERLAKQHEHVENANAKI